MLIFKYNYDLFCRIFVIEMIFKCVMYRNVFIWFCFLEIYLCFLISKEKILMQKNEFLIEVWNMYSNIWMYWKGKEMGFFFKILMYIFMKKSFY